MIILKPEQERMILKYLEGEEPFDNGASRACFDCPQQVIDALGLDKGNYVIKLAVGLGGLSQNHLETLTYKEYGDEYPLAEIFATGRYIEIMEKLLIEHDFRDFVDEGCYWCEDDCGDDYWGFDEETANEVEHIVELLGDLFGHTNDNGQLGWSELQHRYVSYDYGYTTDKYTSEQTSNLTSYITEKDELLNYLAKLSEILEQEQELLGSVEDAILRRVDKYYKPDEDDEGAEEGTDATDQDDSCTSSETWKYGDSKF